MKLNICLSFDVETLHEAKEQTKEIEIFLSHKKTLKINAYANEIIKRQEVFENGTNNRTSKGS